MSDLQKEDVRVELVDENARNAVNMNAVNMNAVNMKAVNMGEEPTEQLSPEDILAEPPDALDISAELAAPPRRKLPWLTLVLGAAVVAGLGFIGGVQVEKGQAPTGGGGFGGRNFAAAGASGSSATGSGATGSGRTGGAAGGGGGFGGFGGGGFGGGAAGAGGGSTVGTVKLVDGSTIYVSDASGNIVKVTTSGSTKVSLSTTGTVTDLKPGSTVTVRGTTDSSGDVSASTVTQVGG
ncbi:hypothetical protein [Streptacidiphilus sp. MAP5-3]|jgi:hypothetical protein|uniref:hypothetical protein n=1 Tax=unclassified Streptacidiphilus TaxID=2643834 RepID=UPI003518DF2A